MEAIYRQTFPESRNVVNPKLQMERQLATLRQRVGSGAGGFLEFLSRSGPVIRSESGLSLTGLNFRDGSLTLNLSASSLETVDLLRERLISEAALAVEIQSASSRDGKVNSRMLIRKGAT
jgi:general secretion pathway protein L